MSGEERVVSWGVVSVADIGVEKVIPGMQKAELCSIDAIASRDKARADDAAARLGIPKAYGSYEGLLADPDIQAVYIPLPNHLHLEWTLAALEAGKHVLCEKPLAVTSADARRMVEAADEAGLLLMEAFMYRFHPMWQQAKRMVDDGVIGELRAIQSFFSFYNVDPENIRNIPDYGGGALLDIGCYPISVSRYFFGSEPTDVKSVIRRDDEFGTDVLTSAVLEFGGRHSTFTCSTQLEDDQRVSLAGTEGRIVIEVPFNTRPDRPTRILHYAGGDPPVDPGVTVHEVAPADQYGLQGEAFSRAILEGAPAPTPPRDAIANLEVIERVFAAAG